MNPLSALLNLTRLYLNSPCSLPRPWRPYPNFLGSLTQLRRLHHGLQPCLLHHDLLCFGHLQLCLGGLQLHPVSFPCHLCPGPLLSLVSRTTFTTLWAWPTIPPPCSTSTLTTLLHYCCVCFAGVLLTTLCYCLILFSLNY